MQSERILSKCKILLAKPLVFIYNIEVNKGIHSTLKALNFYADMAQLVEQLIRNEQVVGSNPTISSNKNIALRGHKRWFVLQIIFCFL